MMEKNPLPVSEAGVALPCRAATCHPKQVRVGPSKLTVCGNWQTEKAELGEGEKNQDSAALAAASHCGYKYEEFRDAA